MSGTVIVLGIQLCGALAELCGAGNWDPQVKLKLHWLVACMELARDLSLLFQFQCYLLTSISNKLTSSQRGLGGRVESWGLLLSFENEGQQRESNLFPPPPTSKPNPKPHALALLLT